MKDVLILGIVEGLSEFLPISSTGHMILCMELLDIKMDEFYKNFLIIIQLGSILAVIFVFYKRLLRGLDIYFKLAIAFLPAGIIGFFAYKYLASLFHGYVVATMLILGGIILIMIEKNYKAKMHKNIDSVSLKEAFLIGLGQAFAIIPGVSRSGACIVAALLVGLDRKSAAEFSFLLAIPTMIIATMYSIYKHPQILSTAHLELVGLGFITAFIIALLIIKLFLRLISTISFVPFGIYRIFIGLVFFYLFYSDILNPLAM